MENLIEFHLREFTKYLLIDYDLIVRKAKVGDGCFRLPWHLLYLGRSDGRSIVLEGPEIIFYVGMKD